MSELGIWEDLIGHGQIIGERSSQQDYYIVSPVVEKDGKQSLLLVLSDGMGGHVGGDIASQLVAQGFVDTFEKDVRNESLVNRHKTALIAADNALIDALDETPELKGMGSTLVAVFWDGVSASWTSIGDSPMWIARRTPEGPYRLDRANDDHSLQPLIDKRLREGSITPQQAEDMPSHQLRSALVGEGVNVDDREKVQIFAAQPVELFHHEYLIVASDGIDTLTEAEICDMLENEPPAHVIVDEVLNRIEKINRPHQDNTTLLVFKLPATNMDRKKPPAVPKSAKMMTMRIQP